MAYSTVDKYLREVRYLSTVYIKCYIKFPVIVVAIRTYYIYSYLTACRSSNTEGMCTCSIMIVGACSWPGLSGVTIYYTAEIDCLIRFQSIYYTAEIDWNLIRLITSKTRSRNNYSCVIRC